VQLTNTGKGVTSNGVEKLKLKYWSQTSITKDVLCKAYICTPICYQDVHLYSVTDTVDLCITQICNDLVSDHKETGNTLPFQRSTVLGKCCKFFYLITVKCIKVYFCPHTINAYKDRVNTCYNPGLWSWNTFSIKKLTNSCLQVGVWRELCVCKLCVGHWTWEFATQKPFVDCCTFICEAIYKRVQARY
jgi:hypothetical protein